MQVKKFEARTMKEALEMVKTQLGPDAIILSARDNNRSFGLVGEGSVEITAAVSEETLQRKKFAESRMREQELKKFNQIPARAQKDIIEKMVNRHLEKKQPPRAITSRKYVDIEDEGGNAAANVMANPVAEKPAARTVVTPEAVASYVSAPKNEEINHLKSEITALREIIAKFQDMPQTMAATHPGADYGIPFDLSFMFQRLVGSGVAADIVAEILVRAQDSIPALKLKNRALVEGWVARHILETTNVTDERANSRVHLFIGPAGSGKTTSLVKMASHMVVKERKKVALLTTDTFKVGAADQMRIFAQILNVPFAILRETSDWEKIMRFLPNVDCVLVDMPGWSLRSAEEIDRLKRIMPPAIMNPRIHLTLSATSKDSDLIEAGRRFSVIGFDDAIFTGLDESVQHGTIYNFSARFGVPLHAFSIGPRVPEDFEPATRERVLDLIFGLTRTQNMMASEI